MPQPTRLRTPGCNAPTARMTQADAISDAVLQKMFLTNITPYPHIVARWVAQGPHQ